MSSTNDTSTIATTTIAYQFSIPPGIGDRLWQYAWLLFAYGVGLIINIILFVGCIHLYKKNYGIIILNQLLINIFYCLLNLIIYLSIYIIVTPDQFLYYYFLPNQPFWTLFVFNFCGYEGDSLFYIEQMALLLLCANRCLTLIDAKWMRPLMSYKMHIVYSAICWVFQMQVSNLCKFN